MVVRALEKCNWLVDVIVDLRVGVDLMMRLGTLSKRVSELATSKLLCVGVASGMEASDSDSKSSSISSMYSTYSNSPLPDAGISVQETRALVAYEHTNFDMNYCADSTLHLESRTCKTMTTHSLGKIEKSINDKSSLKL